MASNLVTETAGNVIRDALYELKSIPAEIEVPAYEAQAGIFYLNAMMLDFDQVGVNLGFTQVKSLGDPVTIDAGAYDPVVKLLASEMAPLFSAVATPQLVSDAREGYKILQQISFRTMGAAPFPDTLPHGSGNNRLADWASPFYNQPGEPLQTETGGNISVESDAS